MPEVLAETDGEYLYIHGKKEAQIPLSNIDYASVDISFPFVFSNEFLATLIVHQISEKYGDLILDIPEYGEYKMRFVSNVQLTANELIAFIREEQNKY